MDNLGNEHQTPWRDRTAALTARTHQTTPIETTCPTAELSQQQITRNVTAGGSESLPMPARGWLRKSGQGSWRSIRSDRSWTSSIEYFPLSASLRKILRAYASSRSTFRSRSMTVMITGYCEKGMP